MLCKNKKWTYEKLMLCKRSGFDYSMINSYDIKYGAKTKIKLGCLECSYIYFQSIHNHINGKQNCPMCAGQVPWNYLRIMTNKRPGFDYSLIDENETFHSNSMLVLRCEDCNYIWKSSIGSHFKKNHPPGCPRCSNLEPWSFQRVLDNRRSGFDYSCVKAYDIKNNRSRLNLGCERCKHRWNVSISKHFGEECKCPKCTYHYIWNFDMVMERKRPGFDYSHVKREDITNSSSELLIGCEICNKFFKQSIHSHFNRECNCSNCSKSKGEKLCMQILDNMNINYIDEYKIEGYNYRYDFYISIGETKFLIEYDGEQHFKFVDYFFKSLEEFEKRKLDDMKKNIIALENNYKLLRIHYSLTDNQIRKYIEDFLEGKFDFYHTHTDYKEYKKNIRKYFG